MRRISLVLVIGLVALGAAAPASAQSGPGDTRCISTSDTPLYVGGPLQPFSSFYLYAVIGGTVQIFAASDAVDSEGYLTFPAGLLGTYQFALVIRGGLEVYDLGLLQIGGCTPPPPPIPTSKTQCMNGGWQSFAFKNQGECIAFVNRGPKPSLTS